MLDYMADIFYPRFDWKVVTTYDKAIQFLYQMRHIGHDTDMPNLPLLSLKPNKDFELDQPYGKLVWRFPLGGDNIFFRRITAPIYQDTDMILNFGSTRIKGELEFLAVFESVYELLDFKIYLLNSFRGIDARLEPEGFTSFVIVPEEIYNFVYTNPVTGESHKISIPDLTEKLVRSTNQHVVVYPYNFTPIVYLTSVSDSSEELGGIDRLALWRINFTMTYEVELPSFMVLQTEYLSEGTSFRTESGCCYSSNEIYSKQVIPDQIRVTNQTLTYSSDTTAGPIHVSGVDVKQQKTRQFKTRYFHIVTKEEAESTVDVNIALPEQILDHTLLIVNGKYGILEYFDDYSIINNGWTLVIHTEDQTKLEEGEVLELFVYQFIDDA
jgi:hypothetical protein